MRILIVAMPWHSVNTPSLALGILTAAAQAVPGVTVENRYANLAWAEEVVAAGGTVTDYEKLALTVFQGIGEWVFSSALHEVEECNVDAFAEVSSNFGGHDRALVVALHRAAPAFVERIADQIAAEDWDVVGFTSTFMQNVSSLAVARALKVRRPNVVTVMGGSNLDGAQGTTIHRAFPFLDFVVRGEGEVAFPLLLRALQGSGNFSDIAGLCWRDGHGSHANEPGSLVPIDTIPCPDFDAYFAQLECSVIGLVAKPQLVLEAARGCWWGEKHHCKFCGLNGSGMKFRSKHPDRVFDELAHLVTRYKTLDVVMVDNILDHRYFETLLPKIVKSGWDLRIHYEIKANIKAEQMRMLSDARITHVQPGIESLSTRVLQLMDKGVSGPQNVAALREGGNEGLTVSWNYLYGFPGEMDEDYESVIEQMPALVHLQPPIGATRIAIERFSPYFNEPDLGFADKHPARFYPLIYGLGDEELNDMVFFFDATTHGIGGALERCLSQAVSRWRELYPHSTLHIHASEDAVTIADRRRGWRERDVTFTDPVERAALLALGTPCGCDSLVRWLDERGLACDRAHIEEFLKALKRDGFVFEQNGKYVLLAMRYDPSNIRLSHLWSEEAVL